MKIISEKFFYSITTNFYSIQNGNKELIHSINQIKLDEMKIHLKFYLEDCFNLCVGLEEFLVQWSLFKEKLDEEEDEEDDIKEAFKMYDKDGDGYITKEEMLEAITAMGFVRY